MSSPDLDTLLLDNWADLDAAGARAQVIEDTVMEALGDLIEDWMAEHDWVGLCDPADKGLWLAAPQWSTAKGKRPAADAHFAFEFGSGDEDDYASGDDWWSLTRLMGVGRGKMGFRFYQLRRSKADWLATIRDPEKYRQLPDFELDEEPSLFLPVKVDKDLLPQALRTDDFSELLLPVSQALERLAAASEIIDPWLGARKDAA
jgi:hypothetical protein